MSTKRFGRIAEGHGPGAAGPAVGRLDREPRRRRRGTRRGVRQRGRRRDAARRHQRPDRGHRGPRQRVRPRRWPSASERQRRARSSPPPPPTASPPPRSRPTSAPRPSSTPPTRRCNLTWQLVAAIGRVESNHGRSGGNTLDDRRRRPARHLRHRPRRQPTTPRRSATPTPASTTTTRSYDRAVGPMQFIPSTWSVVGVDADGDGQRNPQDIDDAALATAVYLCSGDDDLSTDAGPARRGLPLQPQPRRTSTWCCRS